MSIKKDIVWRVYLAFGLICLVGLAIIFQAAKLQIVEGAGLREMADSLTTAYRTIEAERGNIYAADGSLLATSLPFFEVRMDVWSDAMEPDSFNRHVDSLAIQLGAWDEERTYREWKERLITARRQKERYLLIGRKVNYPDLLEMKTWPLFRDGKYKGGFIYIQQNRRELPFRMLASRTIGFKRDEVQPVGLEGAYDEYLAGIQGVRLMQKISGGLEKPIHDQNEIEPQNGNDILTTIDVNVQDVAEDALFRAIKKHDAHHGCVIVMEVGTGKIKAIANIGKYGDGYAETYNYAMGRALDPGSTFKLATMIAVLEEGLVDVDDSVDIEKGIKQFHDVTMKDASPHDHNMVTVSFAFQISSNVGMAKLVKPFESDPMRFIKHLHRMGLNKKTGIELAGEPTPFIKTPASEEWSGISLPWMAIGYENEFTPLQILNLYNAVANDGKMMKPHLVTDVLHYGKSVKSFEPVVLTDQICSQSTLRKVRGLLESVVEEGTAKNIQTDNYKIAGKTGTAQILDREKGYQQVYQASFAGYFPADRPMYSCIVVVNAPTKISYYGSSVAAPVFREIADKIYANSIEMHVAMNSNNQFYGEHIPIAKSGSNHDAKVLYNELGVSFSTDEDKEWVSARKKNNSIDLKGRKVITGLVPNVLGMGLKDALFLLENAGLQVQTTGKGVVREQSLQPGIKAERGDEITIKLS